jgi:hypothetical protein
MSAPMNTVRFPHLIDQGMMIQAVVFSTAGGHQQAVKSGSEKCRPITGRLLPTQITVETRGT